MDSFHIRYKWSLEWEGVSGIMTFDLDLYLQGHSAMTLQKTAKIYIWHILSCPLYNTYSSRWILSILGTNDHWYERVCRAQWPLTLTYIWGGWGCEVSCGGHHRPRGKTTTVSALDGAVFDIAQILAYLVHNVSRSQLYLGFGHFVWLLYFFSQ